MNVDPKQIAKMITEDPDEVNPLDDEYEDLEDADEFEKNVFADTVEADLAGTLNYYNVEAGYTAAGHGKLGTLYIDDGESLDYITTIDDPKNEHWGIDDTYEIEINNENEWAIVVKGMAGHAWYTDDGWIPGEPPLDIRITHGN
jgi:hypothetical protein